MSESKDINSTVSNFEKQMVDSESKLGINPLELWMNEMIEKKRKQKMENEEEQ